MIDLLEYGAVIFTAGPHKGKLAYYDDDAFENNRDQAVIYFGKPFMSNSVLVDHDQIKNITTIEQERFKKENKEFCEIMGIN